MVEKRYGIKMLEKHHLLPWVIIDAALLLYSICSVKDDGRTARERKKGKKFHRQLPEFGGCIWYLRPESVGTDKLDTRRQGGIFCGMIVESGEITVMTEERN